ncbi:hypothetical protein TNCT_417251 [Trichonephila clavata]|uniref:Uncharacterized protein n=1 Tax=Trichonephila clavata TaxID=2740835 RepID=A0A8X6GAS5_TRICU|nr:hypothetical protein TNCT_417251 [Trichonephila clavata]
MRRGDLLSLLNCRQTPKGEQSSVFPRLGFDDDKFICRLTPKAANVTTQRCDKMASRGHCAQHPVLTPCHKRK